MPQVARAAERADCTSSRFFEAGLEGGGFTDSDDGGWSFQFVARQRSRAVVKMPKAMPSTVDVATNWELHPAIVNYPVKPPPSSQPQKTSN